MFSSTSSISLICLTFRFSMLFMKKSGKTRSDRGSSTVHGALNFGLAPHFFLILKEREFAAKEKLEIVNALGFRIHFARPSIPSRAERGVYWTKFECISDKIRRILTNDTCASAALDKLARGKTQKFPIIFICGSPHTPRREAEILKGRKFLVLLPPLQYKHTCNISHYCHRTQYLAIIHL